MKKCSSYCIKQENSGKIIREKLEEQTEKVEKSELREEYEN